MSTVDIISSYRQNGSYSMPITIGETIPRSSRRNNNHHNSLDSDEDDGDNTLVARNFDTFMSNRFLMEHPLSLSPCPPELYSDILLPPIGSTQSSLSSTINTTDQQQQLSPTSSSTSGFSSSSIVTTSTDSDYESRSDNSTLSPSPVERVEFNFAPLDEKLLEEKLIKLGFNNNGSHNGYTIDWSRRIIGNDDDDDDDNDDDDETYRAPLLRSTSLKTGKTPTRSPARGKKVVRFADSLGLEFEYIKLIRQDKLPIIPKSAYQDLKLPKEDMKAKKSEQESLKQASSMQRFTLAPSFVQPYLEPNFVFRVKGQAVCLESCTVSSGAGNLSVTCLVRVANIAFEKSVMIRHTTNNWLTSTDSRASYQPNSCDGWSDKFTVTFSIRSFLPNGNLRPGQRLLFAVRYQADGREYWDNNMGQDYHLVYIQE